MKTKEIIVASIIIYLISQPFLNPNIDPNIDFTITPKVLLSEKERMHISQLELEREKLASDERIASENAKAISQQSSTSIKTKHILYIIGGTFLIGTAGFYRKFTRVSNFMFNARDWTINKSKDIWNAIINGRVVEMSKEEYDSIKAEIKRVNEALNKAREECPNDSIPEDIPCVGNDDEIYTLRENVEESAEKLYRENLNRYRESFIMYDGEGICDTFRCAIDNSAHGTFKELVNITASVPSICTNFLIRPFTKKQFKHVTIFRNKQND